MKKAKTLLTFILLFIISSTVAYVVGGVSIESAVSIAFLTTLIEGSAVRLLDNFLKDRE